MQQTPESPARGYQNPEQRRAQFSDPAYLEGFMKILNSAEKVSKKATALERKAREARTKNKMGEYMDNINAAARIRRQYDKICAEWEDTSLNAEQRAELLKQLAELIS